MRKTWFGLTVAVAAAAFTPATAGQAQAQTVIKVATPKAAGAAIIYMAKDRGYFVQEGLDVHWDYFDNPNDLTSSIIAGTDDIALAGLIAGFFNIAEKQHLKVVAGLVSEKPGFRSATYLATPKAYDAGLRKPQDLLTGNKRISVAQRGSAHQYALLSLARKYKTDPHDMHVIPMLTGGNIFAALKNDAVDGAVMSSVPASSAAAQGIGKIIGYVGDEVPYTGIVLFLRDDVMKAKHDALVHFTRALLHAARDYAAAFEQRGPDGKPVRTAAADDILKTVAKYTEQPVSVVSAAMTYVDPNGNVPLTDLRDQISIWQAEGMVDRSVSADALLDPTILEEARKN